MGGSEELAAVRLLRVGVGDDMSDIGREANTFEHGLIVLLGQIVEDDTLSILPFDIRCSGYTKHLDV